MVSLRSRKKHLLAITYKLPYPLNTGYTQRVYQLLKQLSSDYRISLVSFEDKPDLDTQKVLQNFCHSIDCVSLSSNEKKLNRIRHLFSSVPLNSGAYYSRRMGECIEEHLEKGVDLIYVSDIRMAPYVVDVKKVPRVLDAIDCRVLHYERSIQQNKFRLRAFVDFYEYLKMKDYEPYMVSKFDLVLFNSSMERDLMKAMCPYTDFAVVPAGYDPEYFQPSVVPKEPNSILFTGNLSYPPNQEGIMYFKKKVFPRIKELNPQVHWYIAGSTRNGKSVNRFAGKDIRVVTNIDDLRTYFNRCHVYICPVQTGSGMRFKLVEAMAMGLPVVTTSIGCEGMHIIDGMNALIANTPEGFAHKVVELLMDKNKSDEIARNARAIVAKRYEWPNVVAHLKQMLEKMTLRNELNQRAIAIRKKVA